jgi:outer membrane receptor protein involved in Fe transport
MALALSAAFALTCALTCAGARAQQAPAVQPEGDAAPAIQEVIVTAQKRSEKAHDVPSSVSVMGQVQLESLHVSQLSDLSGYLPSVQIDSSGTPGQTSITVRGIPALGGAAVVGTYLDDTPVGSSNNFANGSAFALDMLPYDVARIEVLRGPQGTLYGASAMGGLLKYVTNDPELDGLSGRAGVGLSSIKGGGAAGSELRAMMNVPLIANELAARISVSNNRTPGYIDNAVTGQSDINRTQQQYGRLALLWKPNQDFKLKFSALRQKIDARDDNRVPLDPVTQHPIYGEQSAGKRVSEPFVNTFDYYALSAAYDLRWADLLYAASYSKTKTFRVVDESNQYGLAYPLLGDFPAGISAYAYRLNLKKSTQELRLTSKPGGTVEWLVGAFHTRETSTNNQHVTAQTLDGAPIAGLDPLFDAELPALYREKAVYGDLTYKLSDRFDVTGGLRYSRNNQQYTENILAGVLAPPSNDYNSSHESVTTYMLSPRYHLSADTMLYARVASGYRPGGPNGSLPGVPPDVKADKLVNYELGMKSFYFQKRASVELAAYQIDWKGIQLSALTDTGISYTTNGGTAKSRGFELTTSVRLSPGWRVGANAAYNDARLTQDAPSVSGKRGDKLQGVPDVTASLTSDYNFNVGDAWSAHVGGGYGWTGARNSGESSDPQSRRQGSYGVLNLNADLSKGAWTVRAYAKNVLNNQTATLLYNVQNALTGDLQQIWAVRTQPRTVGLELEVSF